MFEHEFFDVYAFEEIPLNRDCYLMDEIYIQKYEQSWLDVFGGGRGANAGYISDVAARRVNATSLDLSWYPKTMTRFHEVAVSLPKEKFVTCVGCWHYDEKPHIFVDTAWLEQLHLRLYSVFCLVDAVGVKNALQAGSLSREKLISLRKAIDELGARYPDVSFVSFADSVLLKSNWSVGHVRSAVKYTYRPEVFLRIVKDLQTVYAEILDLSVYAVLTQGSNEYYEDSLLHISESKNHICLNSFGLPFAQLLSIDEAARSAIRKGLHEPAELYMDEQYCNSLRLRYEYDRRRSGKHAYKAKMMSSEGSYYVGQCQELLDNLQSSLE